VISPGNLSNYVSIFHGVFSEIQQENLEKMQTAVSRGKSKPVFDPEGCYKRFAKAWNDRYGETI
jgi:hypothetical protein